jgi:thiamine-phosphate pyrophosphorylase
MSKGKGPGFDLYLISEGTLCDTDDTEEFFAKMTAALEGGVRAVQLREKGLGGGRLLEVAGKLRELTGKYKAKLFINDRVDVAILSGADGVHLPSSGLKAAELREFLDLRGEELLVALSTHSLAEAKEALAEGADFITFGPVFFTQSKARYGEPVGVGRLAEVVESLDIPVFALGGVGRENLGEVIGTGAHGAAMISAILGEKDIKTSAELIIDKLSK